MPAMDTDEPYSLVGRTQTGEFNIYVGTGCVIGQFNSDCQQKKKKIKKQKIDVGPCSAKLVVASQVSG